MSRGPADPHTARRRLHAVVRFIQFRSELAILITLAMGVGAGALARSALPVRVGPPAVFAAPTPPADSVPATRPAIYHRAAPAARPGPASPQVVGAQ